MNSQKQFFLLELLIFLLFGGITIIEIFSFPLFERVFTYSQSAVSWFIGLSFGFVFLGFLQGITKKIKFGAIEKRKEYFSLFLTNLIISVSLVTAIKLLAISFFNQFFIYFHILFFQWIMILYITFKLKNNYVISAKHLVVNESIIILNVALILTFIA